MVDLKRILVGLDLTEMDEVLIKYCSFFFPDNETGQGILYSHLR